jgi:heme exporter protein B
VLSLVCGTPALVAFGAVGAAVTVGLPRGGVLAAVLVVPLSIPVMIFGVGAIAGQQAGSALLLLLALSLASSALSPFAAALALRTGED